VMGLCLLSDISDCTGLGTCHIALERKGQHSLSHSLTLPVLSLSLILWLSVLFTPLLFLYLSLSLSLFLPSPAIYPATTLTPIGQTVQQQAQVIQQQQREGEPHHSNP